MFNIVQNGIKYNKFRGDLIFLLKLHNKKTTQQDTNCILEVEIIDSGCGIEKEQQKYLSVPFRELRVKQDIQKVKNNSIGMGLACSKVIMNQLKGSLALKESIRGKTVFKIEMPVEKRDHRIEELSVESAVGDGHMVLSNYARPLQPLILEYIQPSLQEDTSYLKVIAEKQVNIDTVK